VANPALARSPLQHDRLKAHSGLKTAKHQNQQKDFHHFACHIDTHADRCASGEFLVYSRAKRLGVLLL